MTIKKNLGTADKIVRLVFAVVITILYALDIINGPLAGGLLILSGIFIITVLISFCPIYGTFNFSTSDQADDEI